jgi:hypothetical protein
MFANGYEAFEENGFEYKPMQYAGNRTITLTYTRVQSSCVSETATGSCGG